jgi:hypothetical protein
MIVQTTLPDRRKIVTGPDFEFVNGDLAIDNLVIRQ